MFKLSAILGLGGYYQAFVMNIVKNYHMVKFYRNIHIS